MKQLKKYVVGTVCVLALTGLTGCGSNNGTTERATERTTTATERTTTDTEAATERRTEAMTETGTNGNNTTENTMDGRNNGTTETGVLDELGNDIRNGVEDIGDDLTGTERTTATERVTE